MKTERNSFVPRIAVFTLALVAAAAVLIGLDHSRASQVEATQNITQGNPLPGLTNGQLSLFNAGFLQFTLQWDPVKGMGPVITQQECAVCHMLPVAGGTSPTRRTKFFGKLNGDGTFNPLTEEGGFVLQPISEAKFVPGCPVRGEVTPPDATVTSQRVPPQVLGGGLMDSIDDATIQAFATSKGMGIQGRSPSVPDWNGVMRPGRFGTKGQFASLVQAVGQAFQHDVGVTNPVSLTEDCPNAPPGDINVNKGACPTTLVPPVCIKALEPNDSRPPAPVGTETIQLMNYVMFLAPNTPGTGNANGAAKFASVGCSLCHNPTYTTKPSVKVMNNFTGGFGPVVPALSNQPANLYSDLLIHHLGPTLADCMQLGGPNGANGDEWRTTPLWGLGTRTVFLHDGRTTDLNTAIQLHKSVSNIAACGNIYPDSEANQVIDNFNALSPQDQADVITFLKSL